jgi:hypothetical protein
MSYPPLALEELKPKRKNKRVESGVVNACIRWLWLNHCYIWRQNTGAFKVNDRFIRYGVPGCADIIGLTQSGRFVAVECKSPEGRLTEQQAAFRDLVVAKNGIYILARSLSDLQARVDEFA